MTADTTIVLDRLTEVLADIGPVVVACSGGIDSLLLATVAHRRQPTSTQVVHAVAPAVPGAATARVLSYCERERWRLRLVATSEVDDQRYVANEPDRCYVCKTHLYSALTAIAGGIDEGADSVVVSGANIDDLGDFRPGLLAAAEHGVRHPFVEADITKRQIRALACELGLPDSDLPASPCLASRLYTGTRVTIDRLSAVEVGEEVIRQLTGVDVVRCRFVGDDVRIEVGADDRVAITTSVLIVVAAAMRAHRPSISSVVLDDRPYRQGRAVVLAPSGDAR